MQRLATRLLIVSVGVFCYAGTTRGSMPAGSINLPAGGFVQISDDNDTPEVTDRVARISFIQGDARVRRNGSDEWETLTLNLPLVEADEVSTESGGLIEIQFDKNQHVRLDENSFLKIANLKDEGIALSLSRGSLSLRVTEFDKARSFFEIDAPKTTVAVQRAGRYRVDAGRDRDIEVRTTITEGGEARIYSDNAGFTLKSGRSARIYIDGQHAGEWETGDASRYDDGFSRWSAERENVVEQRLRNANYDKYYDQDIYGAEDLNDHGTWINTADYGHVWQPSRVSLSLYSDWSPYRYGDWRYMQPYGWIWVNDEPWGWATYHHGRWISYGGRWVWSPYGYYRYTRSWWSPALVVINIFNNRVCWYPLPYNRRRQNYNRHFQKTRMENASNKKQRLPVGTGSTPPITAKVREIVPPEGVVSVATKDFGKSRSPIQTAPPAIAKTILMKTPEDGQDTTLPIYDKRQRNTDIKTEGPKFDPAGNQTAIGAAPRKLDAPLDNELRTKRIFGGREPQKTVDNENVNRDTSVRQSETRKTGAVDRPTVVRQIDPVKLPPDGEPETTPRKSGESPAYTPPPSNEKRRETLPPVRETPRYDPPKPIEQPRSEPPAKQPAPAKSEPKNVEKPAPSRKEKPDSR